MYTFAYLQGGDSVFFVLVNPSLFNALRCFFRFLFNQFIRTSCNEPNLEWFMN